MCSSVICGGYGGGYEPPHEDPWYYKFLDAIVWVIWFFYQPVKLFRRLRGKS